ncbi:DUF998 domain-containing protein [Streptomyces sp. NPDC093252]|uniref:DUF998 domain-containing protein n=1 Tax=Streptomyces sp. NPDC093252 TaxID=3154980 RepID=UPI00343F3BB7
MSRSVWLPLGAVVLIVNAVQWVVSEAVAAAAWTDPPYSYARNYISDLGVPDCGVVFQDRVICSPEHTLMNTSFILQGILFAIGVLLIAQAVSGRKRTIARSLAVAHAVGFALVGVFHGSEDGPSYGLALHMIGAGIAIVGANSLLIMAGTLRSPRPARPYRIFSITVGVLGLLSLCLVGVSADLAGVFERASVYAWLLWSVVTGGLLLAGRLRSPVVVENVTV